MSLIGLLVLVIVLALVYWAIHQIGGVFGLSPKILAVADVLLVIVAVLLLLEWAGLDTGLRLRP